MEDREVRIAEALENIGNGATIVAAARDFNIPRATLQDRLNGTGPHRNRSIRQQKLSLLQEKTLVNWILDEERAGRSPSHRQVSEFAALIVNGGDESDDGICIGKNWSTRFFQRWPELKAKPSRGLEATRSKATEPERLEAWVLQVKRLMDHLGVGPDFLYNMDETGMAEGETRHGRVIGSSLLKYGAVTDSDATPWVTAIEAGGVNGTVLTPVVIFTGLSLQGQWFPRDFPSWAFDSSPTGWANARILLKWLKKVFLPETKPENPRQWRILIVHGHSAHLTASFQYTAWTNLCYVLYLPSHTSHVSQPLDVGVFSALKAAFRENTRTFSSFDTTAPIQKQRFISAYADARDKALTPRNLRSGFRATGLWPLDPERLLKAAREAERPPSKNPVPKTPQKPRPDKEQLLKTPKNSTDFRKMMENARKDSQALQRNLQAIETKTAKEMDSKDAQIAALIVQNGHLEADLESQRPRKRRKVEYDPNTDFPGRPAIVKARKAAEQSDEKARTYYRRLGRQAERNINVAIL